MSTVIAFPRARAAAADLAPEARILTRPSNPRNRYDAGLKAAMSRRANEFWSVLSDAAWSLRRTDPDQAARVEQVIAEIRAIRDEVCRSVPEHHPEGDPA